MLRNQKRPRSGQLKSTGAAPRCEPHVRFGSKADMCSAIVHVRLVPIADIAGTIVLGTDCHCGPNFGG